MFANLKFWQCLSTAALFAAHTWLTYESKVILNLLLAILGYVPLLFSNQAKSSLVTSH